MRILGAQKKNHAVADRQDILEFVTPKAGIFYRTGLARYLQSPKISGDEADGAPVWPHLLGSHTSCKVPDYTHDRVCNRRCRDQVDPQYRISQHWYSN